MIDPATPPPAYRRLFWRGAEHAWLAVGTLGLGFVTGEPLGLLIGGVAYALGLVYLPDSGWFRRRVDARRAIEEQAAATARAAEFQARRAQLLDNLSRERRTRYQALVSVCEDISAASAEAEGGELSLSLDTRLRKLDELLWTYLRLLTIEQSLETYLETERREQLDASVATAEEELAALETELAAPAPDASAATREMRETRQKLLASRRERLLALRQRLARVAQARANRDLARSEQERLVEQAKLIRADAVAHKNAESLGARIDLSIEHLAETNRWLSDLAEFKDLTAQLPPLPAGTLLASRASTRAAPPPIPERS
ncbi:MAG: hypothetical protein MUE42_04940 [Opitutaceae bacterium]|jgi:hypothetical protein|nr:hypothetical protein [Opitutaceae bacterium]